MLFSVFSTGVFDDDDGDDDNGAVFFNFVASVDESQFSFYIMLFNFIFSL